MLNKLPPNCILAKMRLGSYVQNIATLSLAPAQNGPSVLRVRLWMAERVVATTAVETRAGLQKRPAFKKPLRDPGRTIEDVLRHNPFGPRDTLANSPGRGMDNHSSSIPPPHEKKMDEDCASISYGRNACSFLHERLGFSGHCQLRCSHNLGVGEMIKHAALPGSQLWDRMFTPRLNLTGHPVVRFF